MKKAITIILIAIIVLLLTFYLIDKIGKGFSADLTGAPTDFVYQGTITVDNTTVPPGTLYLTSNISEERTQSNRLVFDLLSMCVIENGAVPCLSMGKNLSQAFGDKHVFVEGITDTVNVVVVRKLRRLEKDLFFLPTSPGIFYISWTQAISLVEGCKIQSVTQLHNLNVNFKLKDGQEVTVVESMIDEIFSVIDRSSNKCGDIVIATE